MVIPDLQIYGTSYISLGSTSRVSETCVVSLLSYNTDSWMPELNNLSRNSLHLAGASHAYIVVQKDLSPTWSGVETPDYSLQYPVYRHRSSVSGHTSLASPVRSVDWRPSWSGVKTPDYSGSHTLVSSLVHTSGRCPKFSVYISKCAPIRHLI